MMEKTSRSIAQTMPATDMLSPEHLTELRAARARLEHPGFAVKLASKIGAPIEKLIGRLPGVTSQIVNDATRVALDKCLWLAIKTIRTPSSPTIATSVGAAAQATGNAASSATVRDIAANDAGAAEHGRDGSTTRGGKTGAVLDAFKPRAGRSERTTSRLHKLAVAATGAAGGAFGFISLPIELPVTTTLMFRSIGEIAKANGEDLTSAATQLQCLMVLAMGGPSATDDDASYGYFVVRGTMAQTVASATTELAGKGAATHSSAFVTKMIHSVAARFSAQVGEQAAAKTVPVIGAVFGAAINTIFIEHFQEMARGHFTIRRLERLYGEAAIKAAYERVGE